LESFRLPGRSAAARGAYRCCDSAFRDVGSKPDRSLFLSSSSPAAGLMHPMAASRNALDTPAAHVAQVRPFNEASVMENLLRWCLCWLSVALLEKCLLL
jgi:hypothetical protein